MHEARIVADELGEVRQERDHIVLHFAFDLIDARGVELRLRALFPNLVRRRFRDDPELRHGVGGVRLDLEPDAVLRLRRPQRRHFRPCITRNHGIPSPPIATYLISMNSSMPYFEPSRPMPDSFMPPNGATSVEMMPSLTPTMPYSSPSSTRKIRPTSRA